MLRNAGFWISLAVLGAALVLLLVEPTPVAALRNLAFDTYQRWQPRDRVDAGIRVLDVDDESLARIGQWPWPRSTHAAIVEKLAAYGAAVIAFDVIFAEPDRSSPAEALKAWSDTPAIDALLKDLPDHDALFARAIQGAPVVLGISLTESKSAQPSPSAKAGIATLGDDPRRFLTRYHGSVAPLPVLEQAATGIGTLNFPGESGGVVRRVPVLLRLDDNLYPALSIEAVRLARGGKSYLVHASATQDMERFGDQVGIVSVDIGAMVVPTDSSGHLRLYYARPAPERYLPVWRLLAGELAPETFKNAIVFIGTSAEGLKDLRFSPFGTVPGVEIHAQAAEQVLQGSYLSRPTWAKAAEALFLIAVWALLLLLLGRLGALWSALLTAATVGGALALSWYAFEVHRLLIDPLFPEVTAVALFVASSVPRHMQSERQQRWIRRAFSTYISPNLVQHLIENPNALRLGGERRECSFVMTDLAGFTALVERADPTEIVALLNDYLDGMIAIALEHEGTLDRIIGDAVAVMFSAPIVQPDHAERALACALAMDAFADRFAAAKRDTGLTMGRTRIGVNSGQVLVGNVGGRSLFDYRALGDAVNTTSRLEAINRQLGTNICVSGATVARCPGFTGRPIGDLVLSGKSEPVPAFEPLPAARMDEPAIQDYLAAYKLLEVGHTAAEEVFHALAQASPEDPLVRFHAARLSAGETGTTIIFAEK